MFRQGIVGRDQLESSADEIRLLEGRLRGMDEDLAEERDLLKVERVRKQSELSVAQAQAEVAARGLADSKPVPGSTRASTPEETISLAPVEAKRAEVQEVELRMAQVERRRSAIQNVLASLAKVVKELDANPEPPPSPAAPPR
jgi:hypothetical protein